MGSSYLTPVPQLPRSLRQKLRPPTPRLLNRAAMKKHNWQRFTYRLVIALIAIGSVAFGVSGVIDRRLSSGTGSWAKVPWHAEGGDAMVLGLVFVFFGLYLLIVLIRNREPRVRKNVSKKGYKKKIP